MSPDLKMLTLLATLKYVCRKAGYARLWVATPPPCWTVKSNAQVCAGPALPKTPLWDAMSQSPFHMSGGNGGRGRESDTFDQCQIWVNNGDLRPIAGYYDLTKDT